MKSKNTKKIKIGVFIPPPVISGNSASIHSAGIGRIPLSTQQKLINLIEKIDGVEIVLNLNFRNSYIRDGKIYVNNFCLNDLDIFFWYCEIDRSVGSYDLEVLKTLSKDVKVVINPQSFEIGLDKYESHLAIKRSGGSVAETVLFDYSNLHYIENVLNEWGAAVLKPRRGGFGKGVTFINSFAMLRDTVDYIHSTTESTPDKAYMLERFYSNSYDGWVSVTMINGEIMYGYKKRRTKLVEMGSGVTKIYDANEIGGEVDGCEIPSLYKNEALIAYNAIGAEIIGFDMICHDGKPIIIDENTFPGYYEEIFKEVGRDPADEFYKLIISEITKIKKK